MRHHLVNISLNKYWLTFILVTVQRPKITFLLQYKDNKIKLFEDMRKNVMWVQMPMVKCMDN